MKKIFFIIIVAFLTSCIEQLPPKPPTLTIEPDSFVTISPISPITFEINGYGAEDLTKFTIKTTPYLFQEDSILSTFIHSFDYKAKMTVPENLEGLLDDSIITVVFTLSDNYNAAQEIVLMKVVSGYPLIAEDTATLVFDIDTTFFYSTKYKKEMYYDSINSDNLDLVVVYDNELGFILASPNAFFISQAMVDLNYNYSNSGKNHTSLTKFSTSMEQITPKFLYYMEVFDSYIDDNVGYGVGVANLLIGDMLAFETQDNRKGVLIITDLNYSTKSLTFFMKIQK